MSRDRDREYAETIKSNYAKCPLATRVSEALFDLSVDLRNQALQEVAIGVSGMAQDGHDLTAEDYNRVLTAAAATLKGTK
jgi:hypothetical protein